MTKRVYEAAKEYGVPAKTVIKTLEDHHIKAGNFTGIDANMKSILDASFKKGAKGEAQRGQKQENKQTGEGTSRKVNETSRQNKNKKQGNTPKQNNQNHDKKRQNQGNAQNQPNRAAKNSQGQNQGNRPQNSHKGGNNAGQNTQGQQGDSKRTKYFGHSQGGNDGNNRNNSKNKRGGQNNRNNNKNNGSRPHTLLSNVLNKGKHNKNKRNQKHQAPVASEAPKKKNYPTSVELPETIIVKDFAERLGRDVGEVMKKLLMGGIMATINQELDFDTASLIADEFGVTVTKEAPPEDPTEIEEIIDPPETLKTRPPVVTIMGHVDHGKTSLLDAIRQTNVTSHEAGGITQHIGAYQVRYEGKKITFMDTPGHEAFTAMRARGAQCTDISVLVVAADDGVMPQTIEAINHSKAAGVPIIVAINKIDKPAANPDHVKQQLAELELIPEDWGGDTIMVPVSAHTHEGIDDLLEMILLVAEVKELKANPKLPAHGVIIEAKLDKGRGPVATVLVQRGTLTIGDYIIAGTAHGRVRALVNDRGEKVRKAGPSVPVEVLGLNEVPQAGDILDAADEKLARTIAEKRIAKAKAEQQKSAKVSLDDIFNRIKEGELKDLNIVVKADVQGSVEALCASLLKIQNDEVKTVIVHSGVGAINESDVMLASAANALIIGFNVRPDANARKVAEQEKVDIRLYRIIYDAINDVEAAVKGMLAPKFEEDIIGRVEVRQVITISKLIVAGCYVTEGKVTNDAKIRVYRDDIVIAEDEMESLRRFKDDVKEVQAGFECGITLAKFHDIKVGDQFEVYVMKEVAPQ